MTNSQRKSLANISFCTSYLTEILERDQNFAILVIEIPLLYRVLLPCLLLLDRDYLLGHQQVKLLGLR